MEGVDSTPIKLNVGGGKGHPRLPGWTIVDLRDSADLRLNICEQPLPYADSSVDVIFTSHTLEHIPPERLAFVLGEFRRVIKPGALVGNTFTGGLIRILVPDIALAVAAYAKGDREFFERSEVTTRDPAAPLGGRLMSWFYSNSAVGFGHVHCFDEDYLHHWLRRCGLSGFRRSAFRASVLPELRTEAFDRHPNDSLCVDCWKIAGEAKEAA